MVESSDYWQKFGRRRIDRRRALSGGLAGLAALGLAACGSSSNNKKNAGSSANTGNSATRAASTPSGGIVLPQGTSAAGTGVAIPAAVNTPIPLQAGSFGGKLTLAQTLEPSSLDPLSAISGGDPPYYMPMYDYFVAIRHFNTDPTTSLAQKWEIVDDTHIAFHLRPGVQFHDGTPWDSANWQWNMQRLLNPANKAIAAGSLASIDHIETPDPQTAVMVLKEPNAAIFFALGAPTVSPVSRTAQEKFGDKFKSNPVGTGPFTFVEWVTGSHVTVKRNPNYWMKDVNGKQLPYLDQVTVTSIPDANTQFANVQSGSVDYAGLTSLNLLAPAQSDSNLNVIQGVPGSAVASMLIFNTIKPPLDNLNLRNAVAYACDADAVNRTVYFGKYAVGKDAMIQPGGWAYQDTPGRPTFDLAKAKQFLVAGGQPNGFTFDMFTYPYPGLDQLTQLYQANMKQIGITANIVSQDVGTVNDFYANGKLPMFSTGWGATDVEPNGTCTFLYASNAFYNPMKKEVAPGVDALITKGRQTFDLAQRKDIYAQIGKAVLVDACFAVPMILSTSFGAWRKSVGGIEATPDIGITRLQFLWNKGS
jgi:peptide/nickel transport system substrate-binding protein